MRGPSERALEGVVLFVDHGPAATDARRNASERVHVDLSTASMSTTQRNEGLMITSPCQQLGRRRVRCREGRIVRPCWHTQLFRIRATRWLARGTPSDRSHPCILARPSSFLAALRGRPGVDERTGAWPGHGSAGGQVVVMAINNQS